MEWPTKKAWITGDRIILVDVGEDWVREFLLGEFLRSN
jgi:hypothetical protein